MYHSIHPAGALLAVGVLLASSAAHAQDAGASDIETIVVQAHPLSGEGLSQASVTLDEDDIEREGAASIGATVGRQPGIHSAPYGESVGRPVIHGMSGVRVRVMEDRIDAMDASSIGADHAATVEPFLANSIEVLKGASTLLYGVGSIGGVVDVHTGRIPHSVPDALSGKVQLRATDNGNGNGSNGSLRLDGGAGSFAWHIDAFRRSADDYEIPGFAESARLHAAEEAEEEEEDHDEHEDEHEEERAGILAGSRSDASGGAFGASWVGESGFVGFSLSRLRYDYGLPGGHAHHEDEDHDDDHDEEGHHDEDEDEHHDEDEHGAEEGLVMLDLDQTRLDFEAGFDIDWMQFSSLNVRVGMNDYEHMEIEPNGEIATTFANDAFEARIELSDIDGDNGDNVFGAQFSSRAFSALGEEAFVPPVDSTEIGMFWLGERSFDGFDVEAGARIGRAAYEPSTGSDANFTVLSGSLGLVMPLGDTRISLHGDYSRRAPALEELYSDGPHLAAQTVQIGDPGLDEESALSLSATVDWNQDALRFAATAYAVAFQDHIYLGPTGEMDHGLPVLRYEQADAFFRGFDVEAGLRLADLAIGTLELTALFDTVHAALDVDGNDALPRIPQSRVGLGLDFAAQRFQASLDWLRVFEQDDATDFELPTDSYTDLRAHIAADFLLGGSEARVFLQGRNLTDDEQRLHTSFIKDRAPQPGRTIELGFRLDF